MLMYPIDRWGIRYQYIQLALNLFRDVIRLTASFTAIICDEALIIR